MIGKIIFALMKGIFDIYKYSFSYKWTARMVIVCNIFFVIFNLISFILFVPFLKIIFKTEDTANLILKKPVYHGGFIDFFNYCSDLYKYLMNKMANNDPKQALLFVCFSVLIAFILKNFFRYGAIWYQSQLRMAVVRDIRNKVFEKAMRLPLSYYTESKKGDLMARMNSDVGEIEIAVVSILELFYREPIAILSSVAVLIYWSPELTMFSLIILPVSGFIISKIGKSLKRTARQGQEQMGILQSSIDEGLSGIRIIKAFNAVPQIFDRFKAVNLKHQQLITKAFRKRDLSSPLNETLVIGVMVMIVWYGGSLILDNKSSSLTGDEFITYIVLFSQIMRPIQGISNAVAYINKAQASHERIMEVLNADEKIYEAENPIPLSDLQTAVHYENVSFRYKDEWVIKNVSFEIPKGKTVALVGESGSGKSTLADLLPRFYDVTEGRITYDNVAITEASMVDLRNHIGIVTQESILFNDTVRNNIAFGMNNASDEEVMQAAKIANAHDFIMNLENGYDTNIGERGNKLSGGQKQRLSIARAVLKNPAILILDEATSALDTESEKLVQDALEKLMQNRTSLVIAHRLSTVRNADKIIVLSKGEIKESGTHEELFALKGLYHNLCTLQGMEVTFD